MTKAHYARSIKLECELERSRKALSDFVFAALFIVVGLMLIFSVFA